MDISNSLAGSGFQPLSSTNRQVKSDTSAPETLARPVEKIAEANRKAPDQEALARKSNALQVGRVERLNSLDSAPLKTQQALNSYEQTITAAQAYEGGELVGIDLFV